MLRWGRRRYPRTLTVEFSGLFELPSQQRKRLIYAADPVAVERLIEAVLARPTRNALAPIRDAALIAAMGFTVAARPSEWLRSTTWADLYDNTVEFQRADARLTDLLEPSDGELEEGLKAGARAALLFANARDRLGAYRTELEARYGVQPEHGLVFQRLGTHGPMWQKHGTPVVWNADDYKRWTARVWRPARQRAAKAPDTANGVGAMRFYDLRHTATSKALHSTLVMTKHGMNLHNLAAWTGHDVQTRRRRHRGEFRTPRQPSRVAEPTARRRGERRQPALPIGAASLLNRQAEATATSRVAGVCQRGKESPTLTSAAVG